MKLARGEVKLQSRRRPVLRMSFLRSYKTPTDLLANRVPFHRFASETALIKDREEKITSAPY